MTLIHENGALYFLKKMETHDHGKISHYRYGAGHNHWTFREALQKRVVLMILLGYYITFIQQSKHFRDNMTASLLQEMGPSFITLNMEVTCSKEIMEAFHF